MNLKKRRFGRLFKPAPARLRRLSPADVGSRARLHQRLFPTRRDSFGFDGLGLVRRWCVKRGARIRCMKGQRRLRKLVPDADLIRRRAAGETLRELAFDYGVEHTTLGRYFARPEVAKELKQARKQLRLAERISAERLSEKRRLERDVRRKAKCSRSEVRSRLMLRVGAEARGARAAPVAARDRGA